jgi:hypothetical protein
MWICVKLERVIVMLKGVVEEGEARLIELDGVRD